MGLEVINEVERFNMNQEEVLSNRNNKDNYDDWVDISNTQPEKNNDNFLSFVEAVHIADLTFCCNFQ